MNRQRCPRCGAPWTNGAAHVETPELARHGHYEGERVFYCLETQLHVILPTTWREDLSTWLRGAARALRREGR